VNKRRGPKKVKTALWLHEEVYNDLKHLADQMDVSTSELIRIITRQYVEEKGVKHDDIFA
jgi:metal-responsive CopG/Arc/MetJ family transcriptional regulator